MVNVERLQRLALYPVEMDKNADGRFVRRSDTGEFITKVSDRYTLVQNKDLVQPFIDKLGLAQLDRVRMYNANRSFLFEFYTGREFEMGGGDLIKEKVLIRNSYDKTRSFSFMCGAFRMVCTNGLFVAVGSALTFKKIHVGEIPVGMLVNEALSRYQENNFRFWNYLKGKSMTLDQERDLIQRWVPFEEKEPKVAEGQPADPTQGNRITNIWIRNKATRLVENDESIDNQRNGWGLYNQMNQAIDRILTRGQIDKRISGNARAEQYLEANLN